MKGKEAGFFRGVASTRCAFAISFLLSVTGSLCILLSLYRSFTLPAFSHHGCTYMSQIYRKCIVMRLQTSIRSFKPESNSYCLLKSIERSFEIEVQEVYNLNKVSYDLKNNFQEPDEFLCPDVYKNLSQFQRSYEEMEKNFKIYAYKDGHRPLIHQGPRRGIYASEGLFIDTIEQGDTIFLTDDPSKANLFFLPLSISNMVSRLYDPNLRSMKIIRRYAANYINSIATNHPFWNKTQGKDHFFASCHDWAILALREHGELSKNVIKVLCNADKTKGFNDIVDISLPEVAVRVSARKFKKKVYEIMGGLDPSQRDFLLFFAGQMHGKLRHEIKKHLGVSQSHGKIRVFETHGVKSRKDEIWYIDYMKRSKYCLCPRGFDVNSPRLVEAIYYECVPVVISDDYVLPFSNVLDWDKLVVRIREEDVPILDKILESIPENAYRAMQSRLKFARKHFVWHSKPVKYDVFNMVMHSLWTQHVQTNLHQ